MNIQSLTKKVSVVLAVVKRWRHFHRPRFVAPQNSWEYWECHPMFEITVRHPNGTKSELKIYLDSRLKGIRELFPGAQISIANHIFVWFRRFHFIATSQKRFLPCLPTAQHALSVCRNWLERNSTERWRHILQWLLAKQGRNGRPP